MNIEDVKEWYRIADNDFDSAKLLNEAIRRHYEIICYMCAQSAEKYLKGYLIYKDTVPQKTHNLLFLNNLCIEFDVAFENIIVECGFLNRYATDIRYPNKYEISEADVNIAINAVEKIRTFQPILDLRELIGNNEIE